jgi:hypothetical protein
MHAGIFAPNANFDAEEPVMTDCRSLEQDAPSTLELILVKQVCVGDAVARAADWIRRYRKARTVSGSTLPVQQCCR